MRDTCIKHFEKPRSRGRCTPNYQKAKGGVLYRRDNKQRTWHHPRSLERLQKTVYVAQSSGFSEARVGKITMETGEGGQLKSPEPRLSPAVETTPEPINGEKLATNFSDPWM